jgi:hypothetical protein
MQTSFHVKAIWDAEASVWISETDIPGLVIEAETLAEFQDLMETLAPEMLAENSGIHNAKVRVEFTASREGELTVA